MKGWDPTGLYKNCHNWPYIGCVIWELNTAPHNTVYALFDAEGYIKHKWQLYLLTHSKMFCLYLTPLIERFY